MILLQSNQLKPISPTWATKFMSHLLATHKPLQRARVKFTKLEAVSTTKNLVYTGSALMPVSFLSWTMMRIQAAVSQNKKCLKIFAPKS